MEPQEMLGLEPLTVTQAEKLSTMCEGYEARIARQKEIINRLQIRMAELEQANQNLRYRAEAVERKLDG